MKVPTLYVISAIFGTLLLVRAAHVSAEALIPKAAATAANDTDKTKMSVPANSLSSAKETDTADSSSQCLTGDVLEVLQADRLKLTEKLAAVKTREQTLATLQTKLNAQMAQIEAANDVLEVRIKQMAVTANEDITHLVKMYQVMKPKQAAEIFDSMDPAFAAGFLRQMNSERAGMIMANMDSRKSYSISVIMAAKNAKYR